MHDLDARNQCKNKVLDMVTSPVYARNRCKNKVLDMVTSPVWFEGTLILWVLPNTKSMQTP